MLGYIKLYAFLGKVFVKQVYSVCRRNVYIGYTSRINYYALGVGFYAVFYILAKIVNVCKKTDFR
jgi:hypothetical protein